MALLQIARAVAGLGDRGGVDIDLDAGLALGANVGLEIGRDFDDEQELALVHHRVDFGSGDLHGRLEGRRRSPSAIRRDRSEPSSSTMPTERLVASVTAPVATVLTEMLKT